MGKRELKLRKLLGEPLIQWTKTLK
jgi:hypothetical protein